MGVYRCTNPWGILYDVEEIDGELWWWAVGAHDGQRFGNSGRIVAEDAEVLTDLLMPAAMDRLRELVHESGG
jgi:hypothetical protein